jgi:predicted MFS family arabinose efflux permease
MKGGLAVDERAMASAIPGDGTVPRKVALWKCKVYYFLVIGGNACLLPFLPLFYQEFGLKHWQIGLIGASRAACGSLLNPIWGAFADATGRHNATHFFTLAWQAFWYANLRNAAPRAWPWTYAYVCMIEACACCTGSLADSAVGLMCRRYNIENNRTDTNYGRQRLWGAIAWGCVCAPSVGLAMALGGDRVRQIVPFVSFGVLFGSGAVMSLWLEHNLVPEANESDSKAETSAKEPSEDDETAPMWSRLRRVVSKPANAVQFGLFTFMGASMYITDVYLNLWLQDNGGKPDLMGIALAVTAATEIAVFYFQAHIKERFGIDWILLLTPFAYALRQLWYSMIPRFSSPWWVLPAQSLHGLTFALYWSTGNDMVQLIAPRGLTTAMTGLFSAANNVGGLLGSVMGGLVYDNFGGQALFAGVAMINCALGITLVAVKLRDLRPATSSPKYSVLRSTEGGVELDELRGRSTN